MPITVLLVLACSGVGFNVAVAQAGHKTQPASFLEKLLTNYDKLKKPGGEFIFELNNHSQKYLFIYFYSVIAPEQPTVITVSMYVLKVEDIDMHSEVSKNYILKS